MTQLGWIVIGAVALLCIANAVVTISLVRQIGLLHVRVKSTGARWMHHGLDIGTAVARREFQDVYGATQVIGGPSVRPTLLAFVSPSCGTCEEIAGHLAALARAERNLRIVAMSFRHDETMNREAADRWWEGRIPLIVSPAIESLFEIHFTPFAMIIDVEGVVRAKGIVNQIEHLHSLLNALESGYPTTGAMAAAREKATVSGDSSNAS